ncbi:MAG: PAS domain S-box protein [Chthoniobacter sp.]|uniref:PAS domain S-box protein n=1 Tax=Chthoniobacter sp. TaxID=2510640 RepID=UPI0032AD6051
MKGLLSIPMRVALPVLLLSFAAIAGFISWRLDTLSLGEEIESRFIDEAKLRITDWRTIIEYRFRKGDPTGVNLQVSGMTTRNDVRAAFVLDSQDRIMAATAAAAIGHGVGLIEADLPEELKGRNAARLAEVRASANGSVVLSQDRRFVVAYYPLAVEVNDHALRSMRSGILVVVFDMRIAKERAFDGAGREIRDDTFIFGGLAACAWLFVHFALTRRVAGIVATTQQFASGQRSARTGMDGGDELGQVARAFDLMADQIVEDELRRKQIEEKMLRQQTELRVLFDFIPAMICFKDTKNRILRANQLLASAIGKTVAEIEGKPVLEIFPQEAAGFYADDLEVIRSKVPKLGIIEKVHDPEGKEIWIQTDKVPVCGPDGEVIGIVAMAQDITERRRAEEELRWKTAFLEAQVNSSIDGILVVDEHGTKILQNQRMIDLLGIPQHLADDKDDDKQRQWVTDRTKDPARFIERVVYLNSHRNEISRDELEMKDGMVFDRYSAPVVGSDGKYYGRIWTFRDVTERKRTEELLRLLSSAVEQSKESITITDAELNLPGPKILFVNPAFTQMTGYPAAEVIGKTPRILQGPNTDRTVLSRLRKNLELGEAFVGEAINYRQDGSEFNLEWQVAPIRDGEGKITHFVAIQHDITERKRTERELEAMHHQLVETSRLAGRAEVATNVLHNVGNVLNSVNISTSLVTNRVKKSRTSSLAKVVGLLREHEANLGTFITSDPRGQRLPAYLAQLSEHLLADQKATLQELESVRENVEHIKGIVAMQQNYATFGGVKEMINVVQLVEDSMSLNEEAFSRHGVEVIREFENVPPLNVEKHKVLQILVNLLRNAKHACQDSDRQDKRMTVRVANGDGRIQISVMDNGVGISPENLTRIFSHGFTTRKDGHGFGLHSGALAAKEMGGSLNVSSAGPGQGAAFTLELPLYSSGNNPEPQKS